MCVEGEETLRLGHRGPDRLVHSVLKFKSAIHVEGCKLGEVLFKRLMLLSTLDKSLSSVVCFVNTYPLIYALDLALSSLQTGPR